MDWHTARPVETYGRRSWIFVAHQPAERLVVFVHGFLGKAIKTWRNFETSGNVSNWWRSSDMFFFGYDSLYDNIVGTSNRLRQVLTDFYPRPPAAFFTVDGIPIREDTGLPYKQLVVVGHSLGGVVIRRVMLDTAHNWFVTHSSGQGVIPELLAARVFLFSPATGGFGPSGKLGFARELGILKYAEMRLRMAPAYLELESNSPVLASTKWGTKSLLDKFGHLELSALKPAVLFANPDNVVNFDRYFHDHHVDSQDGTTHSSACKPTRFYWAPWYMVENDVVRVALRPDEAYQI